MRLLMLAKTAGAIVFGTVHAFVPVPMAVLIADLSAISRTVLLPTVVLIAVSSTFLGLFVAVSVGEVFEAQTISNFFRFPMIFLCGLFFAVAQLPAWLPPLSYLLPLTCGADALRETVLRAGRLRLALDIAALPVFGFALVLVSRRNIRRGWIAWGAPGHGSHREGPCLDAVIDQARDKSDRGMSRREIPRCDWGFATRC